MSDLRVALVAEGPTDAIIIEAALKALIPRPFVLTQLQPEKLLRTLGQEPENPPGRLGQGWGGVLRWCQDFAQGGHTRFEDDPKLPGFDLFVVHIDADVAECSYADEGGKIAPTAVAQRWPVLPKRLPCPPPTGSADAMRACVMAWAGLQTLGPKTVLCVPSKAIDAWLTAAVFPVGHKLLTNLECNLNVAKQLENLPRAEKIKKTQRDYRARESAVTSTWPTVRQRCTQAERFSTEVAAVVV